MMRRVDIVPPATGKPKRRSASPVKGGANNRAVEPSILLPCHFTGGQGSLWFSKIRHHATPLSRMLPVSRPRTEWHIRKHSCAEPLNSEISNSRTLLYHLNS